MRTWQWLIFSTAGVEEDYLAWCKEKEQEFLTAMRGYMVKGKMEEALAASGVSDAYKNMHDVYLHNANEIRSQIEREMQGKE